MSDPKGTPLGRIRNIGIIAHIDAGKTTTTERILYYSGKEHRMGEVHEGTTVMDYLPDEKERGITIVSAATTFHWLDHQVNLIDTPGHVDFTAEVERSLRVLDGAVVVFCGVAGVEAQSETVWHQADHYAIPRLAFINKLDRSGAGVDHVVEEMRTRLGADPLLLQLPIGEEAAFEGVVDLVRMEAITFPEAESGKPLRTGPIPEAMQEAARAARTRLVEAVAETDDALTEKYLAEDDLSEEEIRTGIRTLTLSRTRVPVLCGSSLRYKGVRPLLDAVIHYLPSPKEVPPVTGHAPGEPETSIPCEPSRKEPLAALVFKITDDPHGHLSYLRVYSGELREGDRVLVAATKRKERINRIWRMHADHRTQESAVGPGEIVAIVGLKFAATGDTLCAEERLVELEPPSFPQTVISAAIEPRTNDDRDKLLETLQRLTREDPTFAFHTDGETGQIIISGMGELHLEILTLRITRDYGVAANTGTPRVTYRETVEGRGAGAGTFEQVIAGKNQFARLEVAIEPQAEEPEVLVDFTADPLLVPAAYRTAITEALRGSCSSGPLGGYPLIHAKITVTGGQNREGEGSDLAFGAAAEHALRQAVRAAGARLLEPIMAVEVTTPEDFLGAILHDLNGRRAEVAELTQRGPLRLIRARAPLSAMFGYATVVRGLSTGRASYSMEPCAYAPVPRDAVAGILGYDPDEEMQRA